MNEIWLEKIGRYFNDEMSAEEKLFFKSEVKTNEELSSYFNLYQEIETTMCSKHKNDLQDEALKASLNKLSAKYFNSGIENNLINHAQNGQDLTVNQTGVLHEQKTPTAKI